MSKFMTEKQHTMYKYSTAQRQLDTNTCAAAWKFLSEDYIMHSIFERVPVMPVPASGKLSGVYTSEHCTHVWINFLMKLNINCTYTMKLWILSVYVPIDHWINCPTEKLLACSCVQYPIPYCLVWYCLVWGMNPLLAINLHKLLLVWPVSWLEADKKIC